MITPRLENYLIENATFFTHTVHGPAFTARDTAHRDRTPLREMAKTVVFLGDGGYGVAVLPANTLVDLPLLADSLGLTELRLASEEELLALFPDTELGAMPAFGNLYGVPVYIDERLVHEPMIAFNGGTHTDTVHMRTREFIRLSDALVVSFARKC